MENTAFAAGSGNISVDKIPLIIVFGKERKEVGKIIENPKEKPTPEEELVKITRAFQLTP